MPAPTSSLTAYTRDALHILQRSLALAAAGESVFYRVAAVQLRLLLCDTTRRHNRVENTALAPRLIPHLHLPPLQMDGSADMHAPPLPLPAWLDLPLLAAPHIRLGDFIRRVCDQDGGAHVDPHAHAGLDAIPNHAGCMLCIAEVAAKALASQMPF